MNAANHTRIDICVCTFRRPAVAETLRSLGVLTVPLDVAVRIIVADNDVTPSARELIDALREEIPFEILYVHAPAQNISLARNACLEAADADFIAFIDDDETASPEWIADLLATARETDADAVLGPVRAIYGKDAPAWMAKGDFHSTFPVWVKGTIRTGYTCNMLLRSASPSVSGRRFSLSLGRTGGEDTEFFSGLYHAGGKIEFAPDAWLEEPVPASRSSFSWLAKRRYRSGQTHGRLLGERHSGINRIVQIALASAKAGVCFLAAGCFVLFAEKRNRYALRGILHCGVVGGLLGAREIALYGQLSSEEGRRNAA